MLTNKQLDILRRNMGKNTKKKPILPTEKNQPIRRFTFKSDYFNKFNLIDFIKLPVVKRAI